METAGSAVYGMHGCGGGGGTRRKISQNIASQPPITRRARDPAPVTVGAVVGQFCVRAGCGPGCVPRPAAAPHASAPGP